MRYLSLFSGIEACSAAWKPLGWTCVAVAEIEPFPAAVLAHHYPSVPNLGDVTAITDARIAALGPIDLVVGGSPCQDLSVAGKRAGLAGERSGLFHEQVRIFHAARTLCGARFLLWENVPGAFSSHGGRDFGIVVGAMAGAEFAVPSGGWGTSGAAVGPNGLVEWRTLDAQYVRVQSHPRAVPQRRRRVFALLDTGDWTNRPPILLEPEGLRRHPAPRREAGERIANSLAPRARGGGGLGSDCDGGLVADTLGVGANQTTGFESEVVAHSLKAEGFDASEDGTGRGVSLVPAVCGTLSDGAHMGGGSTARTPTPGGSSQLPAVAWALQERDAKGADSDTKPGHLIPVGGGFDDAIPIQNATRGEDQNGLGVGGDVMFTLDQASQHAIAFSCKDHGADAGEVSPTLRSMEFDATHANGGGQVAVAFHNRQDPDVSGAAAHPLGAEDNGMGILTGVDDANAEETGPGKVLRNLRVEIGEKAFSEWIAGVAFSFQPTQILRHEMHGGGIRRETDEGNGWLDDRALPREEGSSSWSMLRLREDGRERRPPQGRELPEQLARELGEVMSQLSHEATPPPWILPSLRRQGEGTGIVQQALHQVQAGGMQVRRLTPREAERIQGFPDGWTAVPVRGKPAADGPRYRALGNSMAVNCMRWIGERIDAAMASQWEAA